MMIEEADWIAKQVEELDGSSRLLNLGSSTAHFRTVEQPHIDRLVFAPLRQRGVQVTHVDLKNAPGVDIVADLGRDEDLVALAARSVDVVLCSNLLEHVREPGLLARRIVSLMPRGGRALVTVPRRFPPHGDPLDTMLRPEPLELAKLFPGTDVVTGAVVEGSSCFASTLASDRRLLALNLVRLVLPWYKPRTWVDMVRYLPSAFARYQVSCVVLRKS